jgi:hypothetical protein
VSDMKENWGLRIGSLETIESLHCCSHIMRDFLYSL